MADACAPPCSGNIEPNEAAHRIFGSVDPDFGCVFGPVAAKGVTGEPIEKAFQLLPLVSAYDLTQDRHPA